MNAIANGLKENKTFMSKFFAELDAITATMPKTFNLGTKIPVKQISFDEPITVQVIVDDIVMHCNHAGAVLGVAFTDRIWGEEIYEIPRSALLCDKCDAFIDENGDCHD